MNRAEKYRKKVRGLVLPSQSPGYNASLPDRIRLESIVKSLGISPMLQFSYVAYAEQIARLKATHSGQVLFDEAASCLRVWELRGLDHSVLTAIAERLGITLAPPGPVYKTFGNSHYGDWEAYCYANRIYGSRFHFEGPPSTLVKISLCLHTSSVPVKVKCAVYNSPGDVPTTLAGTTEEKDVNLATSDWVDFASAGTPPVSAGYYCLALWSNGVTFPRTDAGPGPRGYYAKTYGSWPSPMPSWTLQSARVHSIYATVLVD